MEYHIDPKCIEVGTRINSGRFGVVHSGRLLDPSTGQWIEVAVKRMLPLATTDPRDFTRFAKEVMFTAGLSKRCKHVVHVHGWSETEDGQLCLVMGKYGRGTLQELLDECVRLHPQHVLQISLDMASGVAELHAQNMVYNDLKPDNCLVESEGGIVLADFGVLKPVSNSDTPPSPTTRQYGSPLFMAPEKLASWQGARQSVTFAADVWALAVSIMQVATNDPTLPYSSGFDMDDMDKMLNIDKEPPEVPRLPELPGMQQLLQRCLALDPDSRPSAAEVRKALADISNILAAVDKDDEGKSTIHLTTGKLADLQDALASSTDTASGCVIDLCHTFSGGIVGALAFPSRTTLRRGALELPSTCHVSITTHHVKLKDLVVKGAEEQRFTVEVSKAGSLHMANCQVSGGSKAGGAVGVGGVGQGFSECSSLMAKNCSMCSSSRSGVYVRDGASAVLEGCTSDVSKKNGLETLGTGSTATATACSFSSNEKANVSVQNGASAVLQDGCTCNDSKEGNGMWVLDKGSTATASACSFSSNTLSNVAVTGRAAALLQGGCACNDSKEGYGLLVCDKGSTATASGCSFSSNEYTNAKAQEGATILLQDGCKCNGSKQGSGWWAADSGSVMIVRDSSASGNKVLGSSAEQTRGGQVMSL